MISAYIQAGFMPHAGCNLEAASEWVLFHVRLIEPSATITFKEDESRFYMNIEGFKIPTDWYWENNHLLKAIDTYQ